MSRPLTRTQKPVEWEDSVSETVLSAVKTLQIAAQEIEQRPNKILLLGRGILRTIYPHAKKNQQNHLSAALTTIKTFLKQAPKAPQPHLIELIADASKTLERYNEVSQHEQEEPQSDWKERFAALLGTSNSSKKQQEVNGRISQIPLPQTFNPEAPHSFYIRRLAPSNVTRSESDAFYIKAASLYRGEYDKNISTLESLSIVRKGYTHSFIQEEAPNLKMVRLRTILTNSTVGDRVIIEGAFRRTPQGASRSVPIVDSFTLARELHIEFPLCVQGTSFAWALPEKLFSQKSSFWQEIEKKKGVLETAQLLNKNSALLELKNRLFKSFKDEFFPLIKALVSAIVSQASPIDSSWRTVIPEFFETLPERQEPFVFLSSVHQCLQTLLIVRPLQTIEEEKEKAFSSSDGDIEKERLKNLVKRLREHNHSELESLKQSLDFQTYAYIQCLSKLLLPHTQSLLLNVHYNNPSKITKWQQKLQQHTVMQAKDFAQQLTYKQLPSDIELKNLLIQQLKDQIALWG